MARPTSHELTERELEVMHQFWKTGESAVADVRDALAAAGVDLAQTTVGTLVRILVEKGFLEQTRTERPARYRAIRSFEEVSKSLVGNLLDRVFLGSPESLLQCLFGGEKLAPRDRRRLLDLLSEEKS
jgi:predicted transcriptional regulator